MIDYLLYMGEFVTHSDLVEIADEPAEAAEESSTGTSKGDSVSASATLSNNKATAKAKAKGTAKKSRQSGKNSNSQRTDLHLLSGIDKIRLIADWAEKTMMPPPGSPLAEIIALRTQLVVATQVIKTYPTSFLTHPDFVKLIELGKEQIADEEKYPFRLTASLPLTDLRKTIYGTVNVDSKQLQRTLTAAEKRKAEEKLKLLPLPVTIEVHPEITGTNEEIMVFNWFRCSGPEQAKEVVDKIPNFFLALVEGLDDLTITDKSIKKIK